MKLAKLLQSFVLSLAFQFAAVRTVAQTTEQQPEPDRRSNYAALVMNANTEEVLYERNADKWRYPASTAKLMTAYLTFQALRDSATTGITMDTKMRVSSYAAGQPNTQLDLPTGGYVSVEDALNGLIVHSANDAAVVLAEKLGGTTAGFVKKMNAAAKDLGMTSTVFKNPNGRTDASQHTTLKDMSKLAIALIEEFPEYYHLFSQEEIVYKGRTYHNHNPLQGEYDGMDGLKTGYIPTAGFHLVTSATRDGERIIVIVFGAASKTQRSNDVTELLDFGFERLSDSTAVFPPRVREKVEPIEMLEPRPIKLLPVEIPAPELKIPTQIIPPPMTPARKAFLGGHRKR